MEAESHSSSELLTAVLDGPARCGSVLDRHRLAFAGYVVALTPPSEPRMPNGLACRVAFGRTTPVSAGFGKLVIGEVEVLPGPAWDPRPLCPPLAVLPIGPEPAPSAIGTWAAGPGRADALLAGYIAGLTLLHGQRRRAEQLAMQAAAAAAATGATLLRHAARGEVPEPVHRLLCAGDPGPLLAWSGQGMMWLRGLVSAGLPADFAAALARQPAGDLRPGIA